MPATDRDLINSAMGGSQDPNQDDYQSAMGGYQPSIPIIDGILRTGFWNDIASWRDADVWKDAA